MRPYDTRLQNKADGLRRRCLRYCDHDLSHDSLHGRDAGGVQMNEKELLALCLKCIEHPRKIDAFDKAMLIDAVKAKLKPEREWVTLTNDEYRQLLAQHNDAGLLAFYHLVESKLREKNA